MSSRDGSRSWLARKDLMVGVGARDALEARLIQRAGFDFVFSSSLAISASHALPDASILSMNQYLAAARAMKEAVEIPVLADCDTGYGNEHNTAHAVRQFEAAGIAGACFEDKKYPKENSLLAEGRQDLAPLEEFSLKIVAALDARKSVDFAVVARVEALIAGKGQEEAQRRARRYAELGADAVLIHSASTTSDEIVEFVNRWDLPTQLVLVPTNYPELTEERIRKLGKVKMVIYANQVLRTGIKAQESLLERIRRDGGIHAVDDALIPVSRVFDLQGVSRMKEKEREYKRMLGRGK